MLAYICTMTGVVSMLSKLKSAAIRKQHVALLHISFSHNKHIEENLRVTRTPKSRCKKGNWFGIKIYSCKLLARTQAESLMSCLTIIQLQCHQVCSTPVLFACYYGKHCMYIHVSSNPAIIRRPKLMWCFSSSTSSMVYPRTAYFLTNDEFYLLKKEHQEDTKSKEHIPSFA